MEQEIRHWLYRTTPHPRRPIKSFADRGDLILTGSVEERLERARLNARHELSQNTQLLSFGGGNDYAYADGGFVFFVVMKDNEAEVALGRPPFAEKLVKLGELINKLSKKGDVASRIELDYQGKAFIKLKKM